ncbi:MAG: hypothetical protein E7G49_07005, partial [Cutibacterium granulosum]|nr:hypothetical protein [Cutibacterium granulosum]
DTHVGHCSVVMCNMLVCHNGSFMALDMDYFLIVSQHTIRRSLAAKAPKQPCRPDDESVRVRRG